MKKRLSFGLFILTILFYVSCKKSTNPIVIPDADVSGTWKFKSENGVAIVGGKITNLPDASIKLNFGNTLIFNKNGKASLDGVEYTYSVSGNVLTLTKGTKINVTAEVTNNTLLIVQDEVGLKELIDLSNSFTTTNKITKVNNILVYTQ